MTTGNGGNYTRHASPNLKQSLLCKYKGPGENRSEPLKLDRPTEIIIHKPGTFFHLSQNFSHSYQERTDGIKRNKVEIGKV